MDVMLLELHDLFHVFAQMLVTSLFRTDVAAPVRGSASEVRVVFVLRPCLFSFHLSLLNPFLGIFVHLAADVSFEA